MNQPPTSRASARDAPDPCLCRTPAAANRPRLHLWKAPPALKHVWNHEARMHSLLKPATKRFQLGLRYLKPIRKLFLQCSGSSRLATTHAVPRRWYRPKLPHCHTSACKTSAGMLAEGFKGSNCQRNPVSHGVNIRPRFLNQCWTNEVLDGVNMKVKSLTFPDFGPLYDGILPVGVPPDPQQKLMLFLCLVWQKLSLWLVQGHVFLGAEPRVPWMSSLQLHHQRKFSNVGF